MYIQNRSASIMSKTVIVLMAIIGLWMEFASFGTQAWRLLDTWFLLVIVIYYGINGVTAFFLKDRDGRMFCSMLNGAIVTIGLALMIARIVAATGSMNVAGLEDFGCFWINFLLPILLFLDWIVLVKKGVWRAVDPWYWLALVIIYASGILLTARGTKELSYPYDFLNYSEIGINIMVWWIVLVSLIVLVIGYSFVIFDFALGGELRKHIVMPRIKTIVIEEEIIEPVVEVPEVAQETTKEKSEPATKDSLKILEPIKTKAVKKNTQVVEGLKDNKSAKNVHGTKSQNTTMKVRAKKVVKSGAVQTTSAVNDSSKVQDKKSKNQKTSNEPNKKNSSKKTGIRQDELNTADNRKPGKDKKPANNKTEQTNKVNLSQQSSKNYPKITKFAEKSSETKTKKSD